MDVIKSFGGMLPCPQRSAHPRHYKSLDDMLRMNNVEGYVQPLNSDQWAPNGSCPYKGCYYAFFSQADIDRHFRLMDHDVKCKPVFGKKAKKR